MQKLSYSRHIMSAVHVGPAAIPLLTCGTAGAAVSLHHQPVNMSSFFHLDHKIIQNLLADITSEVPQALEAIDIFHGAVGAACSLRRRRRRTRCCIRLGHQHHSTVGNTQLIIFALLLVFCCPACQCRLLFYLYFNFERFIAYSVSPMRLINMFNYSTCVRSRVERDNCVHTRSAVHGAVEIFSSLIRRLNTPSASSECLPMVGCKSVSLCLSRKPAEPASRICFKQRARSSSPLSTSCSYCAVDCNSHLAWDVAPTILGPAIARAHMHRARNSTIVNCLGLAQKRAAWTWSG